MATAENSSEPRNIHPVDMAERYAQVTRDFLEYVKSKQSAAASETTPVPFGGVVKVTHEDGPGGYCMEFNMRVHGEVDICHYPGGPYADDDPEPTQEEMSLRFVEVMIQRGGIMYGDFESRMSELASSQRYCDLVTRLSQGTMSLTYFAARLFMAGRLSVGMPAPRQ
jgi:hypothetical protein